MQNLVLSKTVSGSLESCQKIIFGKSVVGGMRFSSWIIMHYHVVESAWKHSSKSCLPSLVYVHFFSFRSFTCRRRYKNSIDFFVTNYAISSVVLSGRNDSLIAAYWMTFCSGQCIFVYFPLPRSFHASLAYVRNSLTYQKRNHIPTCSCLLR